MQIDHFLSIIAVITTFFGTIIILMGAFRLTPTRIARLSSMPYGGFDAEQLKTLSKEKADVCSGAILIFLAFALQIFSLALAEGQRQILDDHYKIALYLAVSLSTMLLLFVYGFTVSLRSWNEERAKRAAVKDILERALHQNPVERAYWKATIDRAESLLGIKVDRGETVREFLQRLAAELGVSFPQDLRIEDDH